MAYRTYREFEQKIRNCDTNLDIVRLCVENGEFAKKFVGRQDWLRRFQSVIDEFGKLNK